jgi:hypothetical protein
MAKAKAKKSSKYKNPVFEPLWVKVVDSQKRLVCKNLDYRVKSVHLGTIAKRQVPRSKILNIYTRLWPLVSPQSFRHYVSPAYMAVPDIDRSLEDWDDNCLFEDKNGQKWPRFYVVETFAYERLDTTAAPEESGKLAAPVVPWKRDEEIGLFLAMDEHNKPYLKPAIRDIDPDYDPLDEDEPAKPGLFKPEYKVETLADMFGFTGPVEGEKSISSQTETKEYQMLIPSLAVAEFNTVLKKRKITGAKIRYAAMEILAKHSVLCYPTFQALLKDNAVTIQMFRRLLKSGGYHRTGTVGKTAIYRPWAEMYPEGVPEYVLGKLEEAGEVPA